MEGDRNFYQYVIIEGLLERELGCYLWGDMEDFVFFIRNIYFGCYLFIFSKCFSWQEDEKICF